MDGQDLNKGKYTSLEMEDREGKASGSDREEVASLQIDVHDNIEEPFDEEFWEKVPEFYRLYMCNIAVHLS